MQKEVSPTLFEIVSRDVEKQRDDKRTSIEYTSNILTALGKIVHLAGADQSVVHKVFDVFEQDGHVSIYSRFRPVRCLTVRPATIPTLEAR